jgi:hypothetical protein
MDITAADLRRRKRTSDHAPRAALSQAARCLPTKIPEQLAFELDAYGLMGNTEFVLHDDPRYLEQAREAIKHRLVRR